DSVVDVGAGDDVEEGLVERLHPPVAGAGQKAGCLSPTPQAHLGGHPHVVGVTAEGVGHRLYRSRAEPHVRSRARRRRASSIRRREKCWPTSRRAAGSSTSSASTNPVAASSSVGAVPSTGSRTKRTKASTAASATGRIAWSALRASSRSSPSGSPASTSSKPALTASASSGWYLRSEERRVGIVGCHI